MSVRPVTRVEALLEEAAALHLDMKPMDSAPEIDRLTCVLMERRSFTQAHKGRRALTPPPSIAKLVLSEDFHESTQPDKQRTKTKHAGVAAGDSRSGAPGSATGAATGSAQNVGAAGGGADGPSSPQRRDSSKFADVVSDAMRRKGTLRLLALDDASSVAPTASPVRSLPGTLAPTAMEKDRNDPLADTTTLLEAAGLPRADAAHITRQTGISLKRAETERTPLDERAVPMRERLVKKVGGAKMTLAQVKKHYAYPFAASADPRDAYPSEEHRLYRIRLDTPARRAQAAVAGGAHLQLRARSTQATGHTTSRSTRSSSRASIVPMSSSRRNSRSGAAGRPRSARSRPQSSSSARSDGKSSTVSTRTSVIEDSRSRDVHAAPGTGPLPALTASGRVMPQLLAHTLHTPAVVRPGSGRLSTVVTNFLTAAKLDPGLDEDSEDELPIFKMAAATTSENSSDAPGGGGGGDGEGSVSARSHVSASSKALAAFRKLQNPDCAIHATVSFGATKSGAECLLEDRFAEAKREVLQEPGPLCAVDERSVSATVSDFMNKFPFRRLWSTDFEPDDKPVTPAESMRALLSRATDRSTLPKFPDGDGTSPATDRRTTVLQSANHAAAERVRAESPATSAGGIALATRFFAALPVADRTANKAQTSGPSREPSPGARRQELAKKRYSVLRTAITQLREVLLGPVCLHLITALAELAYWTILVPRYTAAAAIHFSLHTATVPSMDASRHDALVGSVLQNMMVLDMALREQGELGFGHSRPVLLLGVRAAVEAVLRGRYPWHYLLEASISEYLRRYIPEVDFQQVVHAVNETAQAKLQGRASKRVHSEGPAKPHQTRALSAAEHAPPAIDVARQGRRASITRRGSLVDHKLITSRLVANMMTWVSTPVLLDSLIAGLVDPARFSSRIGSLETRSDAQKAMEHARRAIRKSTMLSKLVNSTTAKVASSQSGSASGAATRSISPSPTRSLTMEHSTASLRELGALTSLRDVSVYDERVPEHGMSQAAMLARVHGSLLEALDALQGGPHPAITNRPSTPRLAARREQRGAGQDSIPLVTFPSKIHAVTHATSRVVHVVLDDPASADARKLLHRTRETEVLPLTEAALAPLVAAAGIEVAGRTSRLAGRSPSPPPRAPSHGGPPVPSVSPLRVQDPGVKTQVQAMLLRKIKHRYTEFDLHLLTSNTRSALADVLVEEVSHPPHDTPGNMPVPGFSPIPAAMGSSKRRAALRAIARAAAVQKELQESGQLVINAQGVLSAGISGDTGPGRPTEKEVAAAVEEVTTELLQAIHVQNLHFRSAFTTAAATGPPVPSRSRRASASEQHAGAPTVPPTQLTGSQLPDGPTDAGNAQTRKRKADARYEVVPRNIEVMVTPEAEVSEASIRDDANNIVVALPMEKPVGMPAAAAARIVGLQRPDYIAVPARTPAEASTAAGQTGASTPVAVASGDSVTEGSTESRRGSAPLPAITVPGSRPGPRAASPTRSSYNHVSREALGLPPAPPWVQTLRSGNARLPGDDAALHKLIGAGTSGAAPSPPVRRGW